MIERIRFNKVIPKVFVDSPPDGEPSEVWGKDLTFSKGRSYLLESNSGRGKTSFCSFLYGLRTDYQGAIEHIGQDSGIIPADEYSLCELRKQAIAMMFQEHRIFPELTAVENVMLKNQLTSFFTEQEIRNKLSSLGLKEQDRACAYLSLGQQQRVAFVRLLAQPSDFLILDEPVSHLDEENAIIMSSMLRERQQLCNCAIIVTSVGNRLPFNYDKVLKL